MAYCLNCTLCGLGEVGLASEIRLQGNLVAFQQHALECHQVTAEALRNSKGQKYLTGFQTVYFCELPDGRTWLKAVKISPTEVASFTQEQESISWQD